MARIAVKLVFDWGLIQVQYLDDEVYMPKNHRRKTKIGFYTLNSFLQIIKLYKLHTFQSYVDIADCNYWKSKSNDSSMEECVPSFEKLAWKIKLQSYFKKSPSKWWKCAKVVNWHPKLLPTQRELHCDLESLHNERLSINKSRLHIYLTTTDRKEPLRPGTCRTEPNFSPAALCSWHPAWR